MKQRILAMDDIRAGMYITVLRGKIEEKFTPGLHGMKVHQRELTHYNGKVIEVTAVDMPYIAVIVHGARVSMNDSLDLRQIVVMRISMDYIKNMLPDLDIHTDPFWDEIKDTSLEDADTTIEKIFKDL